MPHERLFVTAWCRIITESAFFQALTSEGAFTDQGQSNHLIIQLTFK